jgi:hypothetical protein
MNSSGGKGNQSGNNNIIRSFVAECYVKTIRKLPFKNFNNSLSRLITIIVTKGLRSKELGHREKARKALIKVIKEVSPRYLGVVFESMAYNLQKGF